MTTGQRVLLLRKELKLTQDKFAKPLGVGSSAIYNIEKGLRNLTDQMVISICREYGASEEWLRNGTGEMFTPVSRSEKIAEFAGKLMKDEPDSFKRQLVEVLAELNEAEWEVLAGIAKKLKNE